jgi:hypothetical protein
MIILFKIKIKMFGSIIKIKYGYYYIIIKMIITMIISFINKNLISLYNLIIKTKKNKMVKEIEDIKPVINIDDLNMKIDTIKKKSEEHEISLRKYEQEIKLIESYNKHYEYKIKLVETKGRILNDCLTIIKDVMKDVKCLEH